jgi:uncharacterized membrane protein YgcG
MSTIRNGLGLALLLVAAGCYQESAYGQGSPTMPQQDPQTVQGPPGGGMDPYPAYQAPQQPAGEYVDPSAQTPGFAEQVPQQEGADPNQPEQQVDPDYGTQPVDDATIDATLDAYGSWVDDDDYGRIWVPSATVVGADFTPYESDGSWDYSDSGWMFNCDYNWGWLPFHYGRWGWFDGYWGWVPGHQWGAAWVDWRYGGGYIGWRPLAPGFRDGGNWNVRDHRHEARVMDSQWRFAGEHDFNRPHIAAHTFKNPSEGLRLTQPMRPPVPAGVRPMHSAALMQAHMPAPRQLHAAVAQHQLNVQHRTGPGVGGAPMHTNGYVGPAPQRTYQAPQRPYQVPQNAYRQPYQPQNAYRPPVNAYRPPVNAYRPPMNTYRPPANTYRPPANTYRPPANTYRPSYSAPSHSYSAPSHSSSYSAPSHSTYSAPSHSSGGGGGGGGSHSSGGGGGGHHR